ncbi:MAG: cobalamin-independent methionine synthase II family protein [Acidimicrobiales bacterium]|nr:cobalamin-independent methionine synthase II family protein [Acidimicrobiales bacterium]
MKRSTDRVLTTHTGSLPRPADLLELSRQAREGAADASALARRTKEAVDDVVRRQVASGIDVPSDGELSKPSYATYVQHRLSGFEGESERNVRMSDLDEFPGYGEMLVARRLGARPGGENTVAPPACVADIKVKDLAPLQADIENLRAAAAAAKPPEVFMSSASPGVIGLFFANHHYPSREAYIVAIAEAMRSEYEAIVEAGFVLQLDCPDLAMGRHFQFADLGLEDFRREARVNVEALNHATSNIDPDQMRLHLCWGNYEGPHHRDVPLAEIIDLVLLARPNGISLEAANPRHEHEWAIFEDLALPDGKVLIPGVIDSTNNYIEHPDLVAQRIRRYVGVVGQENVLAGTDCGFGTAAQISTVHPEIAFAKLESLAQGARRASAAD